MLDHIVLDIEIQHPIESLKNGWDDTDKMGVSCAVLYDYRKDRFVVYGDTAVELAELRCRILHAERISGFNIYRFDYPVVFGLPSRSRMHQLKERTNDLLMRIWRALGLNEEQFSDLHRGWSLDVVCKGTLGRGKTGTGAEAPRLYQRGEWGKLITYCLDDVTLERDLADFIDRYGYVVNGKTGQVLRLGA